MNTRREFLTTAGGIGLGLTCGRLPAMDRPGKVKDLVWGPDHNGQAFDTIFNKTPFDESIVFEALAPPSPKKWLEQITPTIVRDNIATINHLMVPLYQEPDKRKTIESGLECIYAAGVDRNMIVFDSDESGLSDQLIRLMKITMRRNGVRERYNHLTHILVPSSLDCPTEVGHGVKTIKCDIDQEYIRSLCNYDHPCRDTFVIGLDLTKDDFRYYVSESDSNLIGLAALNAQSVLLGVI